MKALETRDLYCPKESKSLFTNLPCQGGFQDSFKGVTPVEAWMRQKSMHGSGFNELEPSIRDEQKLECAVHGNSETFLQRGESELGSALRASQFGNAVAASHGD